jgi:hypothetical protein
MKVGILVGLLTVLVTLACSSDQGCADCGGDTGGTAPTSANQASLETARSTSSGGAPAAR